MPDQDHTPQARPILERSLPWVALLIAALTRFWELDTHSLLLDEAFVAVGARDIAFNHTPMWDAISNAPYVWGLAQLMLLLGSDSEWVVRFPSALAAVMTCLLVFRYILREYSTKLAMIAALLFAVHPLAVAFTRIAFVDALQLPFVIIAILIADRYRERLTPTAILGAVIAVMIAFIFKYNVLAILVAWFAAGWLSGRYPFTRALMLGAILVGAAVTTLLFWPYDALPWFFSFLSHGASYDRSEALTFYLNHGSELVLGWIGFVIACAYLFFHRERFTPNQQRFLLHHLLFLVLYVALLVYLGRPFSRYLLVLTFPVCVLWGVAISLTIDQLRSRAVRRLILGGAAVVLLVAQSAILWRNYIQYLRNDVPMRQIASRVREELSMSPANVFWVSVPASVVAYYMDFTQYYSLAAVGLLDPDTARFNHFVESRPYPYHADTLPYGVLLARKHLRQTGLIPALADPQTFIDSIKARDAIVETKRRALTAVNYLESDIVRPNDLMVDFIGFRDIHGEPVLYHMPREYYQNPPLPWPYRVIAAYSPDSVFHSVEYTMYPGMAGARILRK